MKRYAFLVIFALMIIPTQALAAVSDLPDVGGKGFFYDSNTGYTWMDVDNFYGMTFNQIATSLSGTDYHIASYSEIAQLHASLPFASYSSWAPFVGDYDRGYSRIVWGFYEFQNVPYGSWMYSDSQTFTGGVWNYGHLGGPGWNAYSETGAYIDLGAWVVNSSGNSAVPEPLSFFLLGCGLACVVSMRNRLSK